MSDAIAYAEETLRVHHIYNETVSARAKFREACDLLRDARAEKRKLEDTLSEVEMDIAVLERGKHPEFSATAMEKHLKMEFHGDSKWQECKGNLRMLASVIDSLEDRRSVASKDVEIGAARMVELGGYLQFLAVTKQASIATK